MAVRTAPIWAIVLLASIVLGENAVVPGSSVAGRTSEERPARYSIRLGANEAVWVTLDQMAKDLTARVIGPDGRATSFDAFELGAEPVTIEALAAGSYVVEVGCAGRCRRGANFRLQM